MIYLDIINFLVFIIRAFKMVLESGSYALVSDKEDFENKIYDENLNLIEESNIYNLPSGIYIFYINNTNGAFISLVKQS